VPPRNLRLGSWITSTSGPSFTDYRYSRGEDGEPRHVNDAGVRRIARFDEDAASTEAWQLAPAARRSAIGVGSERRSLEFVTRAPTVRSASETIRPVGSDTVFVADPAPDARIN